MRENAGDSVVGEVSSFSAAEREHIREKIPKKNEKKRSEEDKKRMAFSRSLRVEDFIIEKQNNGEVRRDVAGENTFQAIYLKTFPLFKFYDWMRAEKLDFPTFSIFRIIEFINGGAVWRFDRFPVPSNGLFRSDTVRGISKESRFRDFRAVVEIARGRFSAFNGVDPFTVETGRCRDGFRRSLVNSLFVKEMDFMPAEIARNDALCADKEVISHFYAGELITIFSDFRIETAMGPVEFNGFASLDCGEVENDVHFF